jgi:hypothetical protein
VQDLEVRSEVKAVSLLLLWINLIMEHLLFCMEHLLFCSRLAVLLVLRGGT